MVIRVDTHRLAYMAVPKAACSSLKATLGALDPRVDVANASEFTQKQVHGIYPTQRFRMHRWTRVQDYFRFTVVRDPIKRLLGVYTNRVVDLGELNNCRKIKRGQVDLPANPDPDYFFQNLDAYRDVSSVIKHHTLPTVCFTGSDMQRYTKVYRTSDMDQLADDLSEKVGQAVDIPHFNSSGAKLALEDLAPATHRALAEQLAQEYAHLAEFFANPLQLRLRKAA